MRRYSLPEEPDLLNSANTPLEAIQQSLLGVLGKTAPDILIEITKIEEDQSKLDETHDSRNRWCVC